MMFLKHGEKFANRLKGHLGGEAEGSLEKGGDSVKLKKPRVRNNGSSGFLPLRMRERL